MIADIGQFVLILVIFIVLIQFIVVHYRGMAADGKMDSDGIFRAEHLLARHDEKYELPEARKTLHPAGGKD